MSIEREVLDEDLEISVKPGMPDQATDYVIGMKPIIQSYIPKLFHSEMTIHERVERARKEIQSLSKVK